MMPYIPIIKTLGLMVSDKKIFSCFHYVSQCKACVPWGGAIFGPSGIFEQLGKGPLSDATYKLSRL